MGFILKVANRRFDFFNRATVDLKYGHVGSTFSFSAVFRQDNATHRSLFKPLQYRDVQILTTRGEVLITGTITKIKFREAANEQLAVISGYSKSAVLGDCQIPKTKYPLEYNGLTLLQIAQQLAEPFGVTVVANNDEGEASVVIDEISASPSDTVVGFLANIATQRGLILTGNNLGQLEITKANTQQSPIATLGETLPVIKIEADYNGQGLHDSIVVMSQAGIETDNAAESEVKNTLVGAFRPSIRMQNTGNDNSTELAARRVRASELRNIFLKISTDRWEWVNNSGAQTMTPNNIITVQSPKNYIYNRTNFFVERVQLTSNDKEETAIISCVLPEVYDNGDPKFNF